MNPATSQGCCQGGQQHGSSRKPGKCTFATLRGRKTIGRLLELCKFQQQASSAQPECPRCASSSVVLLGPCGDILGSTAQQSLLTLRSSVSYENLGAHLPLRCANSYKAVLLPEASSMLSIACSQEATASSLRCDTFEGLSSTLNSRC
jgi:hypothetical protein